MDNLNSLSESIRKELDLVVLNSPDLDSLRKELTTYITYLIERNYTHLVELLYRIDISEPKLKIALSSRNEPSAMIIADMIIERQIEKIESRKKFGAHDQPFSDEEKW